MKTLKQIKKLAESSYSNNNLDTKKINRITKLLTRKELKNYIKALKNLEKDSTVKLITPKINSKSALVKDLGKLFPNKKILFEEDQNLIAGFRIIDKDDVYDFNIKNTLENLVSYIKN